MRRRLRIFFATAEAFPLAKVGGLGDVGGALPKALARLGHEVTLVLPHYPSVSPGRLVDALDTQLGDRQERVKVYEHRLDDVRVLTLACPHYFDRPEIYGYEDDDERFILFSKAAVELAAQLDRPPDVLHANDWHTGLIPQYVREGPHHTALKGTATVFTIHNLMYQGPLNSRSEALIGLANGYGVNLLARGIASADAVNTVSRHYLSEICTPEFGFGLDELIRSRRERTYGILNGVDYDTFDPASDPALPARFDASTLERRSANKNKLRTRSGLSGDSAAPLLGMVARLVDQKGVDLVCESLDELVGLGAHVVVMGLGDPDYERALADAAARLDGTVAYHRTDEEELARLTYGGTDLFLAPSEFEPCGLGPLIALRYGSIPVVRRTGGLAETVIDYGLTSRRGFGFTFEAMDAHALIEAVATALETYGDRKRWEKLQRRAMEADFSWGRAAANYERMYRELVGVPGRRQLERPEVVRT